MEILWDPKPPLVKKARVSPERTMNERDAKTQVSPTFLSSLRHSCFHGIQEKPMEFVHNTWEVWGTLYFWFLALMRWRKRKELEEGVRQVRLSLVWCWFNGLSGKPRCLPVPALSRIPGPQSRKQLCIRHQAVWIHHYSCPSHHLEQKHWPRPRPSHYILKICRLLASER